MRITHKDEQTILDVLVRPGTIRDELRHTDLLQEANQQEVPVDTRIYYMMLVTYPALIASTVQGKLIINGKKCSWPPTIDNMLDMSREAFNKWYEEVSKCNPDWLPDVEELAKKVREMATEPSTE